MAANSHALLSASSAHRWLNCTPSARLTEAMDDITSEFAKEGTDAHALCEYKLNSLLGIEEEYPGVLEKLSGEGLLKATDRVRLTEKGMDLANYCMSEFIK